MLVALFFASRPVVQLSPLSFQKAFLAGRPPVRPYGALIPAADADGRVQAGGLVGQT